ncbi:unnamed protein product [Cochlearia groenlandica]
MRQGYAGSKLSHYIRLSLRGSVKETKALPGQVRSIKAKPNTKETKALPGQVRSIKAKPNAKETKALPGQQGNAEVKLELG